MEKFILLLVFALTCQLTKGSNPTNPPDPSGSVTCNNEHTVDITLSNVDDLDEWTAADWQLEGKDSCEPTLKGTTVTYTSLSLPDCANSEEKLMDGSIKYTLQISPVVSDSLQSRSYEHTYTMTCTYDTTDKVYSSFVPIRNRADTDKGEASFTFSLDVYPKSDHTGKVPNPVALDQTLYFKASVSTTSSAPNLDLFPTACWSSKSDKPDSKDGHVTLITNGCGHASVSKDLSDTLSYTCASDSTEETFSIQSFRYVGGSKGDSVYFHCDLKVCLADTMKSACECPSNCGSKKKPHRTVKRKRRSYADIVDESEVYHVTAGPFIFKTDKQQEKEDDGRTDDEGGPDQRDTSQSFSTNMLIVVMVSGVIIVGIVCATIFFIARNRRRQRQEADLSLLAELTSPVTSPLDSPII